MNASSSSSTVSTGTPSRKWRLLWRLLAGVSLVAVLAWAFLGYLTPDMMLNWESIASLCGF